MTKCLIVSDKFKGSLSANEVANAIEKGIAKATSNCLVKKTPMADGGEGSLELLKSILDLSEIYVDVQGPLKKSIRASYLKHEEKAFIELSVGSGLLLLEQHERNPMNTTTIGTGQLIQHAIDHGAKHILLFLGGSATNDAGLGILLALGAIFRDKNGQELFPFGKNLQHIKSIAFDAPPPTKFIILCDVDNPMTGLSGAAHSFAKQKGANSEEVIALERGMLNIQELISENISQNISRVAGLGAAGGAAVGLYEFCHAKLLSGFEFIANSINLEEQIKNADCVISGEGKFDKESFKGKVISGVAKLCLKHKKPLYLLVGTYEFSEGLTNPVAYEQIYAITDLAKSQEDAMRNASSYLEQMSYRLFSNLSI